MNVIKRDGQIVPYNSNKIFSAILKAMNACHHFDKEVIKSIIKQVDNLNREQISVEEIQDFIEQRLMESNFKDVAKAYILYRNERTKIRERKNNLITKVIERANANIDDRANANVDEKSFSGREKEASSDIGKEIALNYGGLSEDVANAHKEMLIYQHDLEKAIYGVSNCLNLNFQEIFTYGFRTRNGDVRPPHSFSTACQLVAVAFQCQSQVC